MLFEARALRHVYADGSIGLDSCTFTLRAGCRHVLLGANGSGKTTLLQHLNGLLRPCAGELVFEGRPLDYRRASLSSLRRRVGLVFQNPDHQLISASVFEDVSYGPLNLGLPADTVRQRVGDALRLVGMSGLVDRPVHRLSFGQKKRVCIAGVLAMQPEVLLLDEPLAGLDAATQAELLGVLDKLAAMGLTIVLSSHDIDFAYRWADELHLLADGQCIASVEANDLPRQAAALQRAGHSLPAVIELHRQLVSSGAVDPAISPPRSLPGLLSILQERMSA